MTQQQYIRNFSIIAHIDHGKSTLADRIMEMTETVDERERTDQLLDSMSVERAHGVTVKSRTVRNYYTADDGHRYELNFIDTPGHVDFSYEVSKSLAASEGAILLVDAAQGVQAQTVANFRLAKANGLTVLPVLNKIDSPNADPDRVERQVRALDPSMETAKIMRISAKTGEGVSEVLAAIIRQIPAPQGSRDQPLKALVFDSQYDTYKGVIAYLRLFDGHLETGRTLRLMANSTNFVSDEIGTFAPSMQACEQLEAGDVGYVVTGLKDPTQVRVGDTLTLDSQPTQRALPGYAPAQPMVYAGIFPKSGDSKELAAAMAKLVLNDSSLTCESEQSDVLGSGFRCGFLGAFHLQIIRERLHDEFGIDVLTTAPNVPYRVHLRGAKAGQVVEVDRPTTFPDYSEIDYVEEPFARVDISMPGSALNDVMKLAEQSKGTLVDLGDDDQLLLASYHMPVSEIAYDFFNKLKSVSHGYATMNVTMEDFEPADVVKVEIYINYARVDALSFVLHREDAPRVAQELVHKLKYAVPRRLYPMPTQAVVEGRALARVDIPPLRKNAAVNGEKRSTSKKQALLRRQSANKRAAAQSDIELPQSVFNAILEAEE
ncbi:elongation factor 4 2 [Bombiscardovia nodaiensis]|uniref:Elongation factor 4 n=1 Tax=Bombiscardovia nodaiensis TaxID=2932181 RepID=A0ABN6SAW4_9BIFI|nr:elongation factor 4 2 [Bombiscardovia nodaiensis]